MKVFALLLALMALTGCEVPSGCAAGDAADCERVRASGSIEEVTRVAAELRRRCDQSKLGDSEHACVEAGRLYRDMPALRANRGEADLLVYASFSKACLVLNRPRACAQLARSLRIITDLPDRVLPHRTGDPNSPLKDRLEAARDAATTACDARNADGCVILGEMAERGEGGARDLALAARSYERAVTLGVARANDLRCRLEYCGVPDSAERRAAAAACEAACTRDEQGDHCARHAYLLDFAPGACSSLQRACTKRRHDQCQVLGDRCAAGRATPPGDRDMAILAYRTGCQHGHAETCVPWIQAMMGPGAETAMLLDARREAYALCRQRLSGMPEACFLSGQLHRDVEPVEPAFAREDLDVACNAGIGNACRSIAELLIRHTNLNGSPEVVREYYRRGCNQQDVPSCHEYGVRTLRLSRAARDLSTASRILTRACRQSGHAPSCLPMVEAWLRQRRVGESRVALGQFCPREVHDVRSGTSPSASPYRGACALYSQMLHDARSGVTVAQRRDGYAHACERESWVSCLWLADLEARGVGAAADPTSAEVHYQAACDHVESYRPLAQACTALGILRNSIPRYRDQHSQRTLFERACSFEELTGCTYLAELLSVSNRPEDLVRARNLFRRGCDVPEPASISGLCCHNLSLMEQAGRGGDIDLAAAAQHEQLAASRLSPSLLHPVTR